MIYQILFVFALLIVALESEKREYKRTLSQDVLDKADEKYKEPIGWGFWPSWTVGLPKGRYSAWRKDGEEWKFFKTIDVANDGERFKLSQYNNFEWSAIYKIYGKAHKEMDYDKDGEIIEKVDLSAETKKMRSSPKCFKNHLIAVILIFVAVILALFGCGVFGFWYLKSKQERSGVIFVEGGGVRVTGQTGIDQKIE